MPFFIPFPLCHWIRTILLCCCLLSIASSPVLAVQERVRFVPDGDTVVLQGGAVVRLSGIDAPEMPHGEKPGGYYAETARDLLATLVLRQAVHLEQVPAGYDRYGRTLAILRLPDGTAVNDLLVEQGAALAYSHPDVPAADMARYTALQRQAMQAGRGMWARMNPLLQGLGPVVGNRRSHRFFTQGCEGGDRVAPKNRVVFESAFGALEAGYLPARHCNLWDVR